MEFSQSMIADPLERAHAEARRLPKLNQIDLCTSVKLKDRSQAACHTPLGYRFSEFRPICK